MSNRNNLEAQNLDVESAHNGSGVFGQREFQEEWHETLRWEKHGNRGTTIGGSFLVISAEFC